MQRVMLGVVGRGWRASPAVAAGRRQRRQDACGSMHAVSGRCRCPSALACLLSVPLPAFSAATPATAFGRRVCLGWLALVRAQLGAEDVGNAHAKGSAAPGGGPRAFHAARSQHEFPSKLVSCCPHRPFGGQLSELINLCSQPHPQWSPPARNCLCPGLFSCRLAGSGQRASVPQPCAANSREQRRQAGRSALQQQRGAWAAPAPPPRPTPTCLRPAPWTPGRVVTFKRPGTPPWPW